MSTDREVIFVVARADDGTIARDGEVPWRIREDLKRFVAHTKGAPMIMGRKTFESFPSPLPGRRHIVLTRDAAWHAEGAEVARTVEGALTLAGATEAAVIGGAEINALFLPVAERVELTEIHADYPGDTIMPPLTADWGVSFREEHPAADGCPAFAFVTLRRDL